MKVVPAEFRQHAHHWLILHGRYICVARTPKCPECAIRDVCAFRDKTPPSQRAEGGLTCCSPTRATKRAGS